MSEHDRRRDEEDQRPQKRALPKTFDESSAKEAWREQMSFDDEELSGTFRIPRV